VRPPSFRSRFRLRTMIIFVGLSAILLTAEVGRQRRVEFRSMARGLTWIEGEARVQAEAASSCARYHRSMAAGGGLDPATAAEWTARAERLDRAADDWRRQAESMQRSKVAYEHAALSWLPVQPDLPEAK
jgi:hypothetical protein